MKRYGNTETILHGSLIRAMLSIAVPVIINGFLQTLYNLTDTYWLGMLGKEPLAAINLVSPVQNIVINFGSGLTVAASVMIAQYMGARKQEEACKMANQIFACSMIFACVCASLVAAATPAIIRWLGAEGETLSHGVAYLRLVILDMPFLFMINLFQAVRQAQGDTFRPMLLNLSGISLNMVLDPLLMVGLRMGASGAALATVLSKALPAMLALRLLCRRGDGIRLRVSLMRPEASKLRDILRIGLPTALGGSAMQLGFLLMSRSVYAYGVDAMAAYGIGNKVNGLISLAGNGIGSAAATIVGQNMGAGQTERARRGYLISMFSAMSILFAGGMVLSRPAIATSVVSIFAADPAVVTMAAEYLSILAFWCWTNGVYNATSGLFQGCGHTQVTMAADATRLWVFRFATLYVCQHVLRMGVQSVWYSVVVSNALSSIILLALYFTGMWKKNRFRVQG